MSISEGKHLQPFLVIGRLFVHAYRLFDSYSINQSLLTGSFFGTNDNTAAANPTHAALVETWLNCGSHHSSRSERQKPRLLALRRSLSAKCVSLARAIICLSPLIFCFSRLLYVVTICDCHCNAVCRLSVCCDMYRGQTIRPMTKADHF